MLTPANRTPELVGGVDELVEVALVVVVGPDGGRVEVVIVVAPGIHCA
jgi:hypothetical protein